MVFDHDEFMDCMAQQKGDNQPFVVATVVRTEDATAGKPGDKAIVRADGSIVGWVGGGCALGAVKKAAGAALQDGRPRMIRVRPKEEISEELSIDGIELHGSSCPSKGTTDMFIDPILPRPRILIIGTSPVGRILCNLAHAMGFVVTVTGVAEELESIETADFKFENFELEEPERPYRYVVVSSQGKRDRDALTCGLNTGAEYVAFVGSRRKAEKLKADMIEAGIPAERADVVRSPAGLNIGAVTPDEIALSILADIVRSRRLGIDSENAPIVPAQGQLPEWVTQS